MASEPATLAPTGAGVAPSFPPERLTADGAHFDWYQCTIRDTLDHVLDVFTQAWGLRLHEGTPLYGYREGYDLKGDDGVAVRVLHGGNGGNVHAWASGARAEPFATLVREQWPDEHHVTRMDSAIDFRGDGDPDERWDDLYAKCLDLAAHRTDKDGEKVKRARPIQTRHYGDYVGKERGRTLYMGSPKADALVRLYEKGKQLRNEAVKASAAPLDWCRLEVQIRPKKEARHRAAYTSAADVWGFAVWTQELVKNLHGLEAEHTPLDVWRESDDERALMWLARQYGPTLDRLAAKNDGDWVAVFDMIALALANRDKPDPLRAPPVL